MDPNAYIGRTHSALRPTHEIIADVYREVARFLVLDAHRAGVDVSAYDALHTEPSRVMDWDATLAAITDSRNTVRAKIQNLQAVADDLVEAHALARAAKIAAELAPTDDT
jgi:hypothetical protein